jgi:hypothetical protein
LRTDKIFERLGELEKELTSGNPKRIEMLREYVTLHEELKARRNIYSNQ